ncbi:hypothetical protein G6011_04043 [Alternaria panax]|uniref:Piwi domain-containing protein n=1 Tax=Alternaria panax TaxID=48097 RepID=A0AAD4IGH5_9PLEO|nr:hypothetical protein G6011_04043 [Alternaria panax]
MPLSDEFKASYKNAVTSGLEPCRRCGKFHKTDKCTTAANECYNRGKSLLVDQGTGTPDELRAEAEEVWLSAKDAAFKAAKAAKAAKEQQAIISGGKRKPRLDKNLGGPMAPTPANDGIIQAPVVDTGGVCTVKNSVGTTTELNPVYVTTNYVQVTKVPERLYVYTLDFWRPDSGDHGSKSYYTKRREIEGAFNAMIEAKALHLGDDVAWASDSKDFWCTTFLPQCPAATGATYLTDKFVYRQIDGKKVNDLQAAITFNSTLDNIADKLATLDLADLSDYIRALNAIIAKSVHETAKADGTNLTQIGANKFYLNGARTNIEGLRALRGYFTSIRPGRGSTLLNVNTATSAFLPPGKVSDLLQESSSKSIASFGGKDYIEKMLSGSLVRILYRRQNYMNSDVDYLSIESRTKTFIQFGKAASEQKFYKLSDPVKGQPRQLDPKDIRGKTVLKYFQDTFPNMDLKFKSANELKCVNVGTRVRSFQCKDETLEDLMREQSLKGAQWIPAFLLEIVPNQTTKATLSGAHTTSMLNAALRLPRANATMIEEEGLARLGIKNQTNQSPLAKLGFAVSTDLITIPGKMLELPHLYYGPHKSNLLKTAPLSAQLRQLTTRKRELSSWNLEQVTFAKPGSIGKFHVLALEGSQERDNGVNIVRENMVKTLQSHNMTLVAGVGGVQPQNTSLDTSLAECLVLLKDTDLLRYSQIRRQADLIEGKHTICALTSKPNNPQTRSNLALKVNLKVAGDNHHLDEAVLNKLLGSERRKRAIILGADVTHSGAGTKSGSPSIACVVGSVDKHFMNYPGSMRLQAGGQEQIAKEHLITMVRERVLAYSSNNANVLPTCMLFYRDGVSESQFNMCKNDEIPAILEGYRQAGGDTNELHLTFVVVGKRHHTRFYATDESQTRTCTVSYGRGYSEYDVVNGNLMPGLLIEDVVTNPGNYNFFLQSHGAIKGTARSAHYHVLRDDMELGSASLPALTMQLCSAFSRATHSVSYVAPAYMADRMCERGRAYLRIWANDRDQRPLFELPEEPNGKKTKLSKEALMRLKHDFALKLARDRVVWGPHYNDDASAGESFRLNPWHPNLDQGMFWM